MAKSIIAVDIDDVLAETTELLRLFINRQTGRNLTKEDYLVKNVYHHYYEHVWQSHGIENAKDLFEEFAQELIRDQTNVPLITGADQAMHELSKKFHVILVTARRTTWEPATRRWFKDHFAKDDVELYFTGHHSTDDHKSKGEICKELGVEVLIDDSYDHCESAAENNIKSILFGSYGWTKDSNRKSIVNCKDWPTVLEYFNNAT